MLKLFITTHNTILLVKAGYSVWFQSQVLLVEAKVHERYGKFIESLSGDDIYGFFNQA